MSKPTHTPGKWTISRYDDCPTMVVLDDGKEVETVIAYAYEWDVPKEEQIANARLIATVPTLLEAAEEVVKMAFGDGGYGCCRKDWSCVFNRPSCGFGMDDDCPFSKLKDAVEKAKGGKE